jgi:hypothetical protein
MKKHFWALLSIISFTLTLAQETEHQMKFDSILVEANILYNFEKTIWQSSDHLKKKSNLDGKIGGYIVYQESNTIKNIFHDKNSTKSIATFSYDINKITKSSSEIQERNLTNKEKELVKIKADFMQYFNKNIADFEYQQYEGFTPNLVMIPKEKTTYFYLIMGTSKNNVIPFGNDYFFEWDNNSTLIRWQKFHKSLISTPTQMGGKDMQIMSAVHSHLPLTPYITSTDICTFRLYGTDLYGMKEFQVLSTALDLMFTYSSKTNKILISEF